MLFLLAVSSALAAPPALNLLPFGVGVYVHGAPVRGVAYTVTQAAGFTTLALASRAGVAAIEAEEDEDLLRWQVTSGAAAGVALGSWFVSMVDAGKLHEKEAQAMPARVRAWDRALAAAEEHHAVP